MNIDRLQKAISIMNKSGRSGNVIAEHDELYLWPMEGAFTASECEQLKALGFHKNEDGGFFCFT